MKFNWGFKDSSTSEIGTAEIARDRIDFICAVDRAKIDGRERVAQLYSEGNRILFDKPLAILPGESIKLDYSYNDQGEVEGHAIITLEVNSE